MRGWEAHGTQVTVPAVTVVGQDPPTNPPTALKNRHLDKIKARLDAGSGNVPDTDMFQTFLNINSCPMHMRIPRSVNFTFKKRLGGDRGVMSGHKQLIGKRKRIKHIINFALGRQISQIMLTQVKKIEQFRAVNTVKPTYFLINC